MPTKRLTVLTAITGGKDKLMPITFHDDNVEWVAYMDDPQYDDMYKGWDIRPACTKFKDPVMNAKIHKILAHKYVASYYIVWMDGNRTLKRNPLDLIYFLDTTDIAVFKHYARDCIYKEIDLCMKLKKGDATELMHQASAYIWDYKFPYNMGMFEMSAFIRRNVDSMNKLFERWWAEICRWSNRDQISFPVAFQYEPKTIIPGKLFCSDGKVGSEENDFFTYRKHSK